MIEDELPFYKSCFKGKIVYCNCDDPNSSNFWKFFYGNFAMYGLKKLVATWYSEAERPFKLTFDGKRMGKSQLIGNGDFRSAECVSILDGCDICCTNPPFSLFREMIALLVGNGKKFLLVGNMNAMCYKEIFPLFLKNKVRYGASIHSGDRKFYVPDDYPLDASGCGTDVNGRKYVKVKGVRWFTNMRHSFKNPALATSARYESAKYPRYDSYDAINVDSVKDITLDYEGNMGVPITFLDKFNPGQFEIVGFRKGTDGRDLSINGKCPYFRVIIKVRKTIYG